MKKSVINLDFDILVDRKVREDIEAMGDAKSKVYFEEVTNRIKKLILDEFDNQEREALDILVSVGTFDIDEECPCDNCVARRLEGEKNSGCH